MDTEGLGYEGMEAPGDLYGVKALIESELGRSIGTGEEEGDEWTYFIAELTNRLGKMTNTAAKKMRIAKIIAVMLNAGITEYKEFQLMFPKKSANTQRVLDELGRSWVAQVLIQYLIPADLPRAPPSKSAPSLSTGRLCIPPEDKKAPSDFSKPNTNTPGIGYNIANEFDPSPDGLAFRKLKPSQDHGPPSNLTITKHLQMLGASRGLYPVGEKKSVQKLFDRHAKVLGFKEQDKDTQFCILGSPSASTPNGEMDGSICVKSFVDPGKLWALAVWENKGGEASTAVATRQAAAAYGFGIATGLLGLGIPLGDILVPIVTCTGTQIQFGTVYMLEPCFPVYTHVSPVFDLDIHSQAMTASQYVQMARNVAIETKDKLDAMGLSDLPGGYSLSSMEISLSHQERYFCKELGGITRESKSAIEKDAAIETEEEYKCRHLFRIFNELWEKLPEEDREYVVFPRGIHDFGAIDKETGNRIPQSIIFDNLCSLSIHPEGTFRIGLPDPEDLSLWDAWILELERVMFVIHQAGIVHTDPYPSNIMWRKRPNASGSVDIRIIDWDAAHSVERDGNWDEAIKEQLTQLGRERESLGWETYDTVDTRHDLNYLRILRSLDPGGDEEKHLCSELASGDVNRVNEAFRSAANAQNISGVSLLGYK